MVMVVVMIFFSMEWVLEMVVVVICRNLGLVRMGWYDNMDSCSTGDGCFLMDNTCWRMNGVWFLCAGWLSAPRGEGQSLLPLQSRPMFSFGKHSFGSCGAYLSRRW